MKTFESMLVLLVVAVGLAALARRWKAPYPALLAGLGVALALIPGMPPIALDPQLALALFVAPVLLDAAFDTSPRELRDNWIPITGLVVFAVGITTATVACAAKAMVPDLPWAAAIALGAMVAPPDAAAATAVLKQAKLPHRLTQVLEGESLFNDATALLIYRVAIGAALGEAVSPLTTAPKLLLVVVGSVAFGVAMAPLLGWLMRRIDDVPTAIVLQFAGTFGLWIAAERIGLSGILTVVAYAIRIARTAPHETPARIRVPSYAVWETTVFVLNVLAFVLIGLQIGPIVSGLSEADRSSYARVALSVLIVVIVTRIAWVALCYAIGRRRGRTDPDDARRGASPATATVKEGAVVGWCGMRGIVTLAAAIGLPEGEHGFPQRALILVVAFTVVVGTLVVQGLTLRPLLRWLDLPHDDPVDREVADARASALRAALQTLDGDESDGAKALRFELDELLSNGSDEDGGHDDRRTVPQLRRRAVDAARDALTRMRRDETIGDDAYHRVELVLDRSELYAETGRSRASDG